MCYISVTVQQTQYSWCANSGTQADSLPHPEHLSLSQGEMVLDSVLDFKDFYPELTDSFMFITKVSMQSQISARGQGHSSAK